MTDNIDDGEFETIEMPEYIKEALRQNSMILEMNCKMIMQWLHPVITVIKP